jgi:hypothetical protein
MRLNLPIVAARNFYLPQIGYTNTVMEAVLTYTMYARVRPDRPPARIPLS